MDNFENNRLGTESIVPLMFKLSVPSILSMFIQALYNVVDSIFVSSISEEALAGLTLAFPIQMILIAIAVGTGIGTSSIISRLLGEGNREKASNVAEHVLIIAAIYGIIGAIVGGFFSKNLIMMFTNDPILINYGSRYIQIILLGSMALFIPMISNNILRGEGNTLIPMFTMLIGSILNILLDYLLIFGKGPFPEMGVEGAALATVLSRVISGTFILFILFTGKHELKLNMKNFKFNSSIIFGIYQVGLPAIIMQVLGSFMIGGLNKILAGYSSTAIAAMGIYFRLQSFVFMPVFGLNQGYMPIMGYNYGHKNPDRMKKTMKVGFLLGFTFTAIGFLLFQFFPGNFIYLFNPSDELLAIGTNALKTISIAFPIIGPAIIGSTTFQAIGKGFPSLTLSFLRQIIVLLPMAYILAKLGGLDLIWYSFPLSELISGVVMVFWLTKAIKKVFKEMNRELS